MKRMIGILLSAAVVLVVGVTFAGTQTTRQGASISVSCAMGPTSLAFFCNGNETLLDYACAITTGGKITAGTAIGTNGVLCTYTNPACSPGIAGNSLLDCLDDGTIGHTCDPQWHSYSKTRTAPVGVEGTYLSSECDGNDTIATHTESSTGGATIGVTTFWGPSGITTFFGYGGGSGAETGSVTLTCVCPH